MTCERMPGNATLQTGWKGTITTNQKVDTRLDIGVAMIRISSLITNFNNKNENTERPKVDDYPGHSARNYSSNVDISTNLWQIHTPHTPCKTFADVVERENPPWSQFADVLTLDFVLMLTQIVTTILITDIKQKQFDVNASKLVFVIIMWGRRRNCCYIFYFVSNLDNWICYHAKFSQPY